MKKVYIVTPGLQIINKVIPDEEYERSTAFLARMGMGIFLTVVQWNGWSHFTEYGGFVTKRAAEEFVELVNALRQEAETEGETRPAFEPDWKPIFPLIEKVVEEKETLYIQLPEEEWIRLENGGLDDIKDKLSEEAAEMITLQNPKHPEEHYQLAVCDNILK